MKCIPKKNLKGGSITPKNVKKQNNKYNFDRVIDCLMLTMKVKYTSMRQSRCEGGGKGDI